MTATNTLPTERIPRRNRARAQLLHDLHGTKRERRNARNTRRDRAAGKSHV